MRYYNPKWAAFLSVLTSFVAAFAFPLFGYIFCEFMFIIMAGPTNNSNYAEDRDKWSLIFLVMCVGMGITGFV